MKHTPLDKRTLEQRLAELNTEADIPWEIREHKLHKKFVFENFKFAVGFMALIALKADELDHHPDWCNAYKTVTVDLQTHSAGGITELDFKIAHEMEKVAAYEALVEIVKNLFG